VTIDYTNTRTTVLEAAREMYRGGLVVATSGNVSARCGADALAITASGRDYDSMALDDIVVVDFDGEPIVGDAIPSTEMLMHVAVYAARPDVGAVMHTHSVYASALAVANQPVPAMIDEMVIHFGGEVQVSEYAFPGTEELGENVVAAMGERNAVLIRNHGLVGVGKTPNHALHTCQMVERAAHIYTVANALGNPAPLPADVIETEMELFRMKRRAEEER
jgi:L-fuculose-phosphate aldolase